MIQYSIYIIDDEPTIRDGLTLSLEEDYLVAAFPEAESAIDAMGQNPPDLVLLDIGLPNMDGIEALAKIKSQYPHVLVITSILHTTWLKNKKPSGKPVIMRGDSNHLHYDRRYPDGKKTVS